MSEFRRTDGAVLLLVEDAEPLDEVLQGRRVAVLAHRLQDRQEHLKADPELCKQKSVTTLVRVVHFRSIGWTGGWYFCMGGRILLSITITTTTAVT